MSETIRLIKIIKKFNIGDLEYGIGNDDSKWILDQGYWKRIKEIPKEDSNILNLRA